jgi:hypothetical protein
MRFRFFSSAISGSTSTNRPTPKARQLLRHETSGSGAAPLQQRTCCAIDLWFRCRRPGRAAAQWKPPGEVRSGKWRNDCSGWRQELVCEAFFLSVFHRVEYLAENLADFECFWTLLQLLLDRIADNGWYCLTLLRVPPPRAERPALNAAARLRRLRRLKGSI